MPPPLPLAPPGRPPPAHPAPPILPRPLQRALASLPRIRELNPLVTITAVPKSVASLTDAELSACSVAILCDVGIAEGVAAAERCRSLRVPVFVAASFGFHAFFFVDLGPAYTAVVAKVTTAKTGVGGESETRSVDEALVLQYKGYRDAVLHAAWGSLKPKTTTPAVYTWLGEWARRGARGRGGGRVR
jgi:hypothetical protein